MDTSASAETVERFWNLRNRVIEHWRLVEADPAASPVLVAVVQELSRKAKKAHPWSQTATPRRDGRPSLRSSKPQTAPKWQRRQTEARARKRVRQYLMPISPFVY